MIERLLDKFYIWVLRRRIKRYKRDSKWYERKGLDDNWYMRHGVPDTEREIKRVERKLNGTLTKCDLCKDNYCPHIDGQICSKLLKP